jgi:hypothetical protein
VIAKAWGTRICEIETSILPDKPRLLSPVLARGASDAATQDAEGWKWISWIRVHAVALAVTDDGL